MEKIVSKSKNSGKKTRRIGRKGGNRVAAMRGAMVSVWDNISGTIYAGMRNRRVDEEQKKTKIRAAAENS